MRELLILVGLPASGKSTYAKQLVQFDPSWKRVCRDDLRLMLHGTQYDQSKEACVSEFEELLVARLLERHNVVVDATHLRSSARNRWVKIARDTTRKDWCPEQVHVKSKNFPLTFPECLRRNENRPGTVAPRIIVRMWALYLQHGYPPEIDTIVDFNSEPEP
jgi:predicted kinase